MTSFLQLIFHAVWTSMYDGSKLSKGLVLLMYSSQPAYMICHSACQFSTLKDMDTVMKLLHRKYTIFVCFSACGAQDGIHSIAVL